MNVPLTFLIDDILRTMAMIQKSYFKLNKENAKDGWDHYFCFIIKTQSGMYNSRTYFYRDCKLFKE